MTKTTFTPLEKVLQRVVELEGEVAAANRRCDELTRREAHQACRAARAESECDELRRESDRVAAAGKKTYEFMLDLKREIRVAEWAVVFMAAARVGDALLCSTPEAIVDDLAEALQSRPELLRHHKEKAAALLAKESEDQWANVVTL